MKLLLLIYNSFLVCSLLLPSSCKEQTYQPTVLGDSITSLFQIKGISLVASVKEINTISLQPIVNVNANSVALMPYAFCSIRNPEVRYNMKGQWWGESYAGAAETIRLSHENKLSVLLKPHLWLTHGEYTGDLHFASDSLWTIWENSYSRYILQFATLADSMKVETFCLGTELGSVVKERPAYIPKLIAEVRKIYHGKLTYAANWDDYAVFPFWNLVDYIGIDAYFPLSEKVTPTVNEIVKGWDKYVPGFEKLSKKEGKEILFTEYGYRNTDQPTYEPWKEGNGNRNDIAQANALQGFYNAFHNKSWFAGGFLWKWYLDGNRDYRGDIDFTPQGRVGEEVVRQNYGVKGKIKN